MAIIAVVCAIRCCQQFLSQQATEHGIELLLELTCKDQRAFTISCQPRDTHSQPVTASSLKAFLIKTSDANATLFAPDELGMDGLISDVTLVVQLWQDAAPAKRISMLSELLPKMRTELMCSLQWTLRRQLKHSSQLLWMATICGAMIMLSTLLAINRESRVDATAEETALELVQFPTAVLTDDLNIVHANLGLARLLGIPQGELRGRHLLEFLQDSKLQAMSATPGHLIQTSLNVAQTATLITADAKPVRVRFSMRNAKTQQRTLLLATFVDVSAELELAEIKRDLMAAIGHELRTPLTSIPALISLVSCNDETRLTAEETARLNEVDLDMQTLCSLTTNLLEMAASEVQIMNLTLNSISLKQWVQQCLNEEAEVLSEKGLTPITNICQGLILMDKTKMNRALKDIIAYVARASQPDSPLELQGTSSQQSLTLSVRAPANPKQIPPELDLYFARLILDAHGARMTVINTAPASSTARQVDLAEAPKLPDVSTRSDLSEPSSVTQPGVTTVTSESGEICITIELPSRVIPESFPQYAQN